jgi:hypothetical protein
LTTSHSADVYVVTEDSDVGGGNGKRYFGESRVERFNTNDIVPLVPEAKDTKKTFDFDFGIRGPHTDVITMLICDTRPLDAKFEVDTIAVGLHLK